MTPGNNSKTNRGEDDGERGVLKKRARVRETVSIRKRIRKLQVA